MPKIPPTVMLNIIASLNLKRPISTNKGESVLMPNSFPKESHSKYWAPRASSDKTLPATMPIIINIISLHKSDDFLFIGSNHLYYNKIHMQKSNITKRRWRFKCEAVSICQGIIQYFLFHRNLAISYEIKINIIYSNYIIPKILNFFNRFLVIY